MIQVIYCRLKIGEKMELRKEIGNLSHKYWKETKKQYLKKFNNTIDDETESLLFQWIKWWGNGGGVRSIEQSIITQIGKSNTYEKLWENIERDSYFHNATCVLYADVLKAMIIEVNDENWRRTAN